ncbi:FAD-binding oxidoreductase [Loktanella sp. D2R18]|uniref:NAD(P)/FAD-dependent oxidoreductase n=1 Tax=Rhodobacterales TaxID=204455 RepID=UPI000DE92062|nr:MULTISPECIES: FAD-binding oxidoreductase [Rhodobacterales]MDO6590220.1 FAD-binding oxidoreductase [Yoonia sp. 1_MG-2023]RBW42961.1 FAD-binding oxidoreductase [Loktanella sp. D2R18]
MPHTSSYYAATANIETEFPQLTSDITADVAIIGGGFTGVATALELAERGLSVVLCEANQIGWGATGRNGGQITGSLSGDKAMEREFRRTLGDKAADFVWDLRWRGHDIIRKRIAKYNIDCDLRFGQMQTALTKGQLAELEGIYASGCHRGMSDDLEMISEANMPEYLETDLYIGGLLNRKNMHLHSLNFCLGQAEALVSLGGKVFENSEVTNIEHGTNPIVRTKHGSVRAEKVMLAGNAYHLLEQPKLRGKLFPASLANMATAPLSEEDAAAINPHNLAVYDGRFVLDYYRLTADNRVMFGGGTNYSGRDSKDVARELRPALERTFPRLKGVEIDYSWSGMDGIVLNRIPQVGRIGSNVFYVQGYSGHGIALSHILAEMTAHCITENSSEFEVFENCRHWNLPVGRKVGSLMIAVGMAYYALRDKIER